MTVKDVEALRAQYRESYHRKTAARRAKGLCVKCGKCPPTPGRTRCERSAEAERLARRMLFSSVPTPSSRSHAGNRLEPRSIR